MTASLAFQLDLSLQTGRSPLGLMGGSDVWSPADLAIGVAWRRLANTKCSGCGRPLSQHTHNETLGREEAPADYMVYSIECPAGQALAVAQQAWREENKSATKAYHEGKAVDPAAGLHWMVTGPGERLPKELEVPNG